MKPETDTKEDEKPQGEEEKTKEQMKQCRTVVDLIEAFPLLYNRDRGIMICEECVEVEGDDSKEVKVKSGLEGQRILTAAFRNMKKHITSHLLSSNHKISENVEKRRRKKTQQLTLKEKSECALLGFATFCISV